MKTLKIACLLLFFSSIAYAQKPYQEEEDPTEENCPCIAAVNAEANNPKNRSGKLNFQCTSQCFALQTFQCYLSCTRSDEKRAKIQHIIDTAKRNAQAMGCDCPEGAVSFDEVPAESPTSNPTSTYSFESRSFQEEIRRKQVAFERSEKTAANRVDSLINIRVAATSNTRTAEGEILHSNDQIESPAPAQHQEGKPSQAPHYAIQDTIESAGIEYLEAAKRKLQLSKQLGSDFKDSARLLIYTSIDKDPSNADAFVFRSDLMTDLIDRLRDLTMAHSLKPEDADIKKKLNESQFKFKRAFFTAISNNKLSFVQRACKYNFHIGLRDENNRSPVTYSIQQDRPTILKFLLERRAENSKEYLNELAALAVIDDAPEVLSYLLEQEEVDLHQQYGSNITLLTLAAYHESQKAAAWLIQAGIQVDQNLQFAAQMESAEANQEFMAIHALTVAQATRDSLLAKTAISMFPTLYFKEHPLTRYNFLEEAVISGNDTLVSFFSKQNNNPYLKPKTGPSYLALAIKHARHTTFRLLFEMGLKNEPEESDFVNQAIEHNDAEFLRFLIDKGFDLSNQDAQGNTPLHLALLENKDTLAKILINGGSALDRKNHQGWSALHIAVWQNKMELTKLLLQHKVDINLPGEHGWTPLHYAVREDHQAMVQLLLRHNANKDLRDDQNRTPGDIAKERRLKALKKML